MSILLNKAGLESDTAFKVREEFSPGAKSLAEVRHFGGVSLGDMGEGLLHVTDVDTKLQAVVMSTPV